MLSQQMCVLTPRLAEAVSAVSEETQKVGWLSMDLNLGLPSLNHCSGHHTTLIKKAGKQVQLQEGICRWRRVKYLLPTQSSIGITVNPQFPKKSRILLLPVKRENWISLFIVTMLKSGALAWACKKFCIFEGWFACMFVTQVKTSKCKCPMAG